MFTWNIVLFFATIAAFVPEQSFVSYFLFDFLAPPFIFILIIQMCFLVFLFVVALFMWYFGTIVSWNFYTHTHKRGIMVWYKNYSAKIML